MEVPKLKRVAHLLSPFNTDYTRVAEYFKCNYEDTRQLETIYFTPIFLERVWYKYDSILVFTNEYLIETSYDELKQSASDDRQTHATSLYVTETFLIYGTSATALNKQITCTARADQSTQCYFVYDNCLYKVDYTGMKPDTNYRLRALLSIWPKKQYTHLPTQIYDVDADVGTSLYNKTSLIIFWNYSIPSSNSNTHVR
jgi:hypothetical protein